jgi:hypothetical protein
MEEGFGVTVVKIEEILQEGSATVSLLVVAIVQLSKTGMSQCPSNSMLTVQSFLPFYHQLYAVLLKAESYDGSMTFINHTFDGVSFSILLIFCKICGLTACLYTLNFHQEFLC